MKHTDVLVIGGSAAGLAACLAAKAHYPEKSVMQIRKEEKAVIPCGIPYIFGSLETPQQDILPDTGLEKEVLRLLSVKFFLSTKIKKHVNLMIQLRCHG